MGDVTVSKHVINNYFFSIRCRGEHAYAVRYCVCKFFNKYSQQKGEKRNVKNMKMHSMSAGIHMSQPVSHIDDLAQWPPVSSSYAQVEIASTYRVLSIFVIDIEMNNYDFFFVTPAIPK